MVVDATGTIVFANAQIAQTFGYDRAELIGRPVEVLLPERFREGHPEHRARFGARPHPRPMGAALTLHGLHKNGTEFPVEISLSPVSMPTGLLVVAAVRDATLRLEKEERLIAENRAKIRFLSGASHDLRQPLQTLHLLNRAAARHAGSHPQLRGLLDRQQRALDSMSALLASVLDISKLDSGAVVPNPVTCAIDDVLERLRTDFEPQAADKRVELAIEPCTEAVDTDPELLRRLLGNLLSNAIRYTDSGSVRVTCKPLDAKLTIEVRDTGIGIPADKTERIFEEFYQVDRGAERPEGLGLGLSIVRRLAGLLNATVEVESQERVGTTFRVTVPRASTPLTLPARQQNATVATGGRVLIVDDEREVAEALALLLELEGFETMLASSEADALREVTTAAPDVIVSDYQLRAGQTGLGVVNAVRKRLSSFVPVVFLTGDTARSELTDSPIAVSTVLSKPVQAEELLAAVRRHMARHPC